LSPAAKPDFFKTIGNGKKYPIKALLYSDESRSKLIGTHTRTAQRFLYQLVMRERDVPVRSAACA